MRSRFFNRFIYTALAIAVLVGANVLTGGWLQDRFYRIINVPGQSVRQAVTWIQTYSTGLRQVQALLDENKQLSDQHIVYQGLENDVEQLTIENNRLKQQLQVQTNRQQLQLVSIIDVQRTSVASSLIVQTNADMSFDVGLPVVAHGNVLIGTIDEVFGATARVRLLDDPKAAVSVLIRERNILAQTKGRLHNRVAVDLVPAQDRVELDDTVVTSGLDELPQGLLVGTITSINTVESALFQDIQAALKYSVLEGSELFVIHAN